MYAERLGKMGMIPCPNPDCSTAHESEREAWYHLQDAHSHPSRKPAAKAEKERDVFVREDRVIGERKRRRAHVKQEASGSQLALARNNESTMGSIWSESTPAGLGNEDPRSSDSYSVADTPMPSLFDDNPFPGDFSSVTSMPSPSSSVVDIGQLGEHNHATQAPLDERHVAGNSDVQQYLPETPDIVTSEDVLTQHENQNPPQRAGTGRCLPSTQRRCNVPMELMDPELCNEASSAACMKGVLQSRSVHSIGYANSAVAMCSEVRSYASTCDLEGVQFWLACEPGSDTPSFLLCSAINALTTVNYVSPSVTPDRFQQENYNASYYFQCNREH
ncbi:hypothetical protein AUP68_06462 [Ilyonectria robusta]